MAKLSQIPIINGDAFSNVGSGFSGVNNIFNQILSQAQARQQMHDAAQRIALQQQLAPYTMMRSMAYAQQVPAQIAQANAKAQESLLKLNAIQSLLSPQANYGNQNLKPQKISGVIQESNGDLSPPDSIVGRFPPNNATFNPVQNNNKLSPETIQKLNALGVNVKQTPEELEQQKEQSQEKFESFKNAKEIRKNVNTAADRLTNEAENLADILDSLKSNAGITHVGLGIPLIGKAFGTDERGELKEKLGKIVTDETRSLTGRPGIQTLNFVSNTLKPSMGNSVQENIGMTKALITDIGRDFENLKKSYESEDAGNGGKGSFKRDLPPRAKKIYEEYLAKKRKSENNNLSKNKKEWTYNPNSGELE